MLNVAGPALAFLAALTAILTNFSLHKIEEGEPIHGVLEVHFRRVNIVK